MLQDTGTSNNKQDKTWVDKEAKSGLLKHLPDRASPLTAQSSMQGNMPPLISYIQRQFHHLGENSIRLTKWMIGRHGLAPTVLRAIRPPLLSRAFVYIRRKASFIPPMWQRTLDLPWYSPHRNRRRRTIRTTGTSTDRNMNLSLQPNEIYPDTLLQFLGDIEEEQLSDGVDETYPLVINTRFPTNNNLISSPLTIDGLPITSNISPVTSALTLSPHINKKPDKGYKIKPAKPLTVTAEEPSVRKVDKAQPAVIKNLFSQPVLRQRLIGTARKPAQPPINEQTRDGIDAVSGTQFAAPQTRPGNIPSSVNQPCEIREPDHTQPKDFEDRMTTINQQTQYTGPGQRLSLALMPIIQRMIPQHKPTEVYPETSAENISEELTSPIRYAHDTKVVETDGESANIAVRQAAIPFIARIPEIRKLRKPILSAVVETDGGSAKPTVYQAAIPLIARIPEIRKLRKPILSTVVEADGGSANMAVRQAAIPLIARIPGIRKLRKPILSTIHRMPAVVISKKGAILKHISTSHISPALSEFAIPEAAPKHPRSLISRILHKSTPRIGRDWNRRTSVNSFAEQEVRKADALYEAQSMADISQGLNRLHFTIPEYGSINQNSIEGHMNKFLPYREPSSTDIPHVQPLALSEKIHDIMTVPSQQLFKSGAHAPLSDTGKKYRLLRGREFVSSTPDFDYAYQKASEKLLAFSIQPKAERGISNGEELLTDISENIHELPYSRSLHTPELSLFPVTGYTPAMTSSQITRAELPKSGDTEINKEANKPDIDVIAKDVYRILKRRLSVERERKLGVF